MKPPYGFRYNDSRDGLLIYEPERLVVERIFRLAAERHLTRAIQTRLYREGAASPTGKEVWHRPTLKRMILSDTYKPHTYEEAIELVPPAVAATLAEGSQEAADLRDPTISCMRQGQMGLLQATRPVGSTTVTRQNEPRNGVRSNSASVIGSPSEPWRS
jgi:hypothetical protein